jgi:hypothetical protein
MKTTGCYKGWSARIDEGSPVDLENPPLGKIRRQSSDPGYNLAGESSLNDRTEIKPRGFQPTFNIWRYLDELG